MKEDLYRHLSDRGSARGFLRYGVVITVIGALFVLLGACTVVPVSSTREGTEPVHQAEAPLETGMGTIPSGQEAAPQDVERADSELLRLVSGSYPNSTPDELALLARSAAEQLYLTEEEIVRSACEDPVYTTKYSEDGINDTFYAAIARHYEFPVLWTAFLNYYEKYIVGDYEVFVGCYMPYYRVHNPLSYPDGQGSVIAVTGQINPAGPGQDVAYFPARLGHPFMCFPVNADGTELSGAFPIPVHPSGNVIPVSGRTPERARASAQFNGEVFLWCPVDFTEGIKKWEANGEDDPVYLDLLQEAKDDLAQYWNGDYSNPFYNQTIEEAASEFEDILTDSLRAYAYLLSVSGLESAELADGSDVVPLLDYMPTCLDDECGNAYQMGLSEHDDGAGGVLYSLYQNLPGKWGSPWPHVPLNQPQETQYCQSVNHAWDGIPYGAESCGFSIPTDMTESSLYVLGDLGVRTSGGVGITNAQYICDESDPPLAVIPQEFVRLRSIHHSYSGTTDLSVCSGTNVEPLYGALAPLWLGPAHYIVGMTRAEGVTSIFKGTMDYIWFDPDQSTGT